MLKKIYYLLDIMLFIIIATLILIFPILSYKIGLATPIFPAVEVILVYYFNYKNSLKSWIIIIMTILLDQLNSLALGTSLIAFLIGNFILKKIKTWMDITNPQSDYVLFSCYAALIFTCKYLLIVVFGKSISIIEFGFQYLTTLFTYPLFKFILDKNFMQLRYNVRSQNT